MKRVVAIAGVLLLVGTFGFGMEVSFGVQGAVGHAGFLGSDYADALALSGWERAFFLAYGAGIFITVGDRFAVQPEAMFWRLGGADSLSGYGTEYLIANYLAPAVLLKANLGRISLFAGPMAMFKLGSGKYKVKLDGGGEISSDYGSDQLSSMLFAATGGIGFLFPSGRGQLSVELRGIYSFTSIVNQDLYTDMWNPYAILVMVGYGFPIGR